MKDIWALRVLVKMEGRVRELALFNLGIDSELRGCDLVALKVRDVCHGEQVASRVIVMQHRTQRPVQFEITAATRQVLTAWIKKAGLKSDDFLFPSRLHQSPHLGTRHYGRILGHWVTELGLDRADYGTHSMRKTKATLIYRRTKNLRAVQLLVGHSKLKLTVRYFGIEVDDVGLRTLGTARSGAYFSEAPLFGVIVSFAVWREAPTLAFWLAAAFMALGIWLHLCERNEHDHTHAVLEHGHRHVHDEHHRHEHEFAAEDDKAHSHPHRHDVLTHRHPHYPDIYHRHVH